MLLPAQNAHEHARIVQLLGLGDQRAVKGVGFRRGQSALGVDLRQLRQLTQRDIGDPHARLAQRVECGVEGARDRRLDILEHHRLRQRQAQSGERKRRQIDRGLAGENGIERGTACDSGRQRADGVERRRQRKGSRGRNAMRRRLKADDAAQRRRDAARAAGIGAERAEGHAVGDRHRGTRGRAAGDAPRPAVVGVERRAVMRVDAQAGEGELGHIGAPDRNEPGRAQAGDRGRIACRRLPIFQCNRARRGHVACDVEQILDRHRNAGERRRRRAARADAVMKIRRCERLLSRDLEKNAPPFSGLIRDPRQAFLDQAAAFAGPSEVGLDLGERSHGGCCHGSVGPRAC